MKHLVAIAVVLVISACQSAEYCPAPDRVRMKKSSGRMGMKGYKVHLREKAQERREMMAQHKQLLKVYNIEGKKVDEMEEWDCPRPNSRHARMVKRQYLKREKLHEQALRKDKGRPDPNSVTLDELD